MPDNVTLHLCAKIAMDVGKESTSGPKSSEKEREYVDTTTATNNENAMIEDIAYSQSPSQELPNVCKKDGDTDKARVNAIQGDVDSAAVLSDDENLYSLEGADEDLFDLVPCKVGEDEVGDDDRYVEVRAMDQAVSHVNLIYHLYVGPLDHDVLICYNEIRHLMVHSLCILFFNNGYFFNDEGMPMPLGGGFLDIRII